MDREEMVLRPRTYRFGDHALPSFLLCLLARAHHLEHLLFRDPPDLGQRHGEARGLFGTLVLDAGAQGLGGGGVVPVEQVGGHGVGGLLVGGGGLDVALLVGLDLLAHLDLLLVALLGVQLGAQAAQVLGFLGGIVALAGGALASALLVVESSTVQLSVPLHVLVLRLLVRMAGQFLLDA